MLSIAMIKWIQVGCLSVGALSSIIFLIMYRNIWDLKNYYSRFIIAFNFMFIISVIFVILGRIIPANFIIEVIKVFGFALLSITLAIQIVLFRYTHREGYRK